MKYRGSAEDRPCSSAPQANTVVGCQKAVVHLSAPKKTPKKTSSSSQQKSGGSKGRRAQTNLSVASRSSFHDCSNNERRLASKYAWLGGLWAR